MSPIPWFVLVAGALLAPGPAPIAFSVSYGPGLAPGPISERVYVFVDEPRAFGEPRTGLDWFQARPIFALQAKDWKPNSPLIVDDKAEGFPTKLSELPPGEYVAQAVVRLGLDSHDPGKGPGNAYGPVVRFKKEAGAAPQTIALLVDKTVKEPKFRESERVKLVELESPMLSQFHKRPIKHRAAVVLPADLKGPEDRRAVLFIVPGFGGDHTMAPLFAGRVPSFDYGHQCIKVVLDPDCLTGHHVFADSPRNGPRGEALVRELVPYLDSKFPTRPEARHRLLNGHSSGGWSTLWLAVNYPDVFSATWSTSPDPVDFRDFCGVDLYATNANVFVDPKGQRRPIARRGDVPILWTDDFSKQEDVVGDGGQLHSFEAVFSPLGADGRELPLYDRKTGAVVPDVAKAWEKYDLRLLLERNWGTLGPKLQGRLHVYTGAKDTFYLEGATRLLEESLGRLGSDAQFLHVAGRDHFDVLDGALSQRIDREIKEWLASAEGGP